MPKHIKITSHFGAYNPGEKAMFDDEIADQIIDRKLGVEEKIDVKAARAKGKSATSDPGSTGGDSNLAGDAQ